MQNRAGWTVLSTLGMTVVLTACGGSTSGGGAQSSPSGEMMKHSPSPSGEMMKHSPSPSGAMIEHSPSPKP